MSKYFLPVIFLVTTLHCAPVKPESPIVIQTGAERMNAYLPQLKDRSIGLFVNHTSLVGSTPLIDTLLNLGIQVKRIFTPEHGFTGLKADGEVIEYSKDSLTFDLVSLYGSTKRPSPEQLKDLDLIVIDIQDVGVRFYTYVSTMTYLMEACAVQNIPILLLDRPNPNGSYIDGPVLDEKFESFIGLHPIPLVHGCTLGELALMINGEGWLEGGATCNLEVIRVNNWEHSDPYSLPVRPSPNLPNDLSIALYPSLALFEGTVVSVGRGTDNPFQIIGHPLYSKGNFTFVPQPNAGSKYPPLEGEQCRGMNLSSDKPKYQFTLGYLITFYNELSGELDKPFFNDYFMKLAGTDQLQKQIEDGWSEDSIRDSWQEKLDAYREIQKKYQLYSE